MPVGSRTDVAEHLIAAAQSDDDPAAPDMGADIDIPALGADERQVRERRLGSRQDDEIGVARQGFAGPDEGDGDVGLGDQRIEIVEIGDPGEHRHGDADVRIAAGLSLALQRHRVLGGQQACRREPRRDAETGEARPLGDDWQAAVEQADVAAELVDDVTLEMPAVALVAAGPRCRQCWR